MKAIVLIPAFLFCTSGMQLSAQQSGTDSTGMPGDNLDLYAVLDQFKKSDNLETFEKSINDPNNKINNLDLNQDGETDYIKVIDHADSGAHAIVLQVPVNEKESQDVAVIEVEQEGVENARIQIVGDEDVYGKDYVVEPYENYVGKDEYDAQQRVKNSRSNNNNNNTRVVVNVWTWPCVTYIYRPVYRPWRSPWYWGYYPGWWRPWRPYHWHVYHGYVAHYHGPGYYYHHAHVYHMRTANRIYHHRRTTSATYQRSAPVVKNHPQRQHPRMHEGNRNIPNQQGRHRANSGRQPQVKEHHRQRAPQHTRQRAPQAPRQHRQHHNNGGARPKPSGHRK